VRNPKLVRTLIASVALVLSLSLVAVAQAKRDSFEITGGKSVLSTDVDTFEALSSYGVTVTPIDGAKENAHGLVFPITGGVVQNNGPTGTVEHSGGVEFTNSGGVAMDFEDFVLKISHNKGKLFATSGPETLRFLNVDLSGATFSGYPDNLNIKNLDATLAKPAAEALTALVGTRIDKGTPIGTLKIKSETKAQ
jgi:hypothetical protein